MVHVIQVFSVKTVDTVCFALFACPETHTAHLSCQKRARPSMPTSDADLSVHIIHGYTTMNMHCKKVIIHCCLLMMMMMMMVPAYDYWEGKFNDIFLKPYTTFSDGSPSFQLARYGAKVDIYAAGVVLYMALLGLLAAGNGPLLKVVLEVAKSLPFCLCWIVRWGGRFWKVCQVC